MIKRRKIVNKKLSDSLKSKQLPPVTRYLSTGCTLLDLAISDKYPGGFAVGRINHISGEQSATKTVLLCEPLGSAQRKGGKAYLIDVETTFDDSRAHIVGLTIGNKKIWEYDNEVGTIEELFDVKINNIIEKNKEIKKIVAVGIDSLTALPSIEDVKGELGKKEGYGTIRAKRIGAAFRKYLGKLATNNVTLIFVDQSRDVIDSYIPKTTYSGGKAVGFYSSTQVEVKQGEKIKNEYNIVIGLHINYYISKNKISIPFRSGKFRFLFDYGIDDISTSLLWLKENKFMESGGGWYDFNGTKSQGLNGMVDIIENRNWEEALQREVYNHWKEIYKPSDRKEKIR